MLTVLHYVCQIAFQPARVTEKVLAHPQRLRIGLTAWLLFSLCYGVVNFIGGLNGVGADLTPFLPIPSEQYHLWVSPLLPVIYLVT